MQKNNFAASCLWMTDLTLLAFYQEFQFISLLHNQMNVKKLNISQRQCGIKIIHNVKSRQMSMQTLLASLNLHFNGF